MAMTFSSGKLTLYVFTSLVFVSSPLKHVNGLSNNTYVVTTITSEPYVMYKPKGHKNLTGTDGANLEGMFVDVLENIAKRMGFKYSIHLVADGSYGGQRYPNVWTGMIGELVNGKADIAMGDITITASRSKVVSFSQPLLKSDLRIIQRKPITPDSEQKTPSISEEITEITKAENLFFLLTPFAVEVWIVLIIAFVVASILLYLLVRFSPMERDDNSDNAHTTFSVDKCFLYTIRSLTLQGTGVTPKSFSGRVLCATWWCVCLIVIASYIANLTWSKEGTSKKDMSGSDGTTAIETGPTRTFVSFRDLSQQTAVKYGVFNNGALLHHFRVSKQPMEEKMYAFMISETPSVFVKTNMEGLARVRASGGKYAFIAESTFAEYHARRPPCDLVASGEPIRDAAYAFACRNSDLCDIIDTGLLQLRELGLLHQLKDKWFSGGCDTVDDVRSSTDYGQLLDSSVESDIPKSSPVTIGRMLFAWLIFIIGSVLSFAVLGLELVFCGKKRKKVEKSHATDDDRHMKELMTD